MKDKWLSHFKDGPTNSTKRAGRIYFCKMCGKKLSLLSTSHTFCSKECRNKQLALKKAKYRDKKRRG